MSVKAVNGGYVIDFTLNHERFRETIPAPHNKTAAKRIEEQEAIYKMAISLNDKAIASRFPNSKIMQKAFDNGCNYTIHDYSNIWFKQKQRNWSHTTIRGYTQKYNSYIKPNWGHLILNEFKASMFDEWASECLLSGKSINETRNVLSQIFKRAYFDGVIESNPVERIERYKQEAHDLAYDALQTLKKTKFFDSHRVFIDPRTMKEYKYADGLRKYIWKPTLEKLKIPYRYPYQCRHTYASMMLSAGKNPMWVAKQMGHADWGMIRKIYGRWLN
ncbi:hypothetical protein AVL56_11015 [Alteromonas stellipolaris]|uniref:tyrosine-type recombinase/integrase n=1 Tax=Alteromonas stellipolaris TaxID=233316 RepID=UPI00077061CC|nr:tyrosine-type recombinase/integrase [Alteromonas stellipolaris]AMJ94772.1 hypothetical protein AVL56_11015 [Alteromonas stellipolaris]